MNLQSLTSWCTAAALACGVPAVATAAQDPAAVEEGSEPAPETSPDGASPDSAPLTEGPAEEGPAEMDSEKAAMLPLTVTGELEDHVREEMQRQLADGLTRAKFNVITTDQVLSTAPSAGDCLDAACYKDVATATDARYLVRTEVTVTGRDYNYNVILIDGTTGDAMAEVKGVCEICGHEEATEMIVGKATTLRLKIDATVTAPPTLVVTTEPAGARVLFDDEVLGVTPLEVVVDSGEHDIRIEKEGFITRRERLGFVDGATETIGGALNPVPETPKKSKLFRALGWGGVGAGGAALISGIALMAIEERPITSDCSGENIDPMGNCKFRYATLEGGIALAVTGLLVAGGGVALLLIDRKNSKARRSKAVARIRPTGAGLQLKF